MTYPHQLFKRLLVGNKSEEHQSLTFKGKYNHITFYQS